MNAGKELDVLVSEKVMGVPPSRVSFDDAFFTEEGHPVIPPYSTNMEAAMKVAEKVDLFSIAMLGKNIEGRWMLMENGDSWFVFGDSAPHAICAAALQMVADK